MQESIYYPNSINLNNLPLYFLFLLQNLTTILYREASIKSSQFGLDR